jgi:hypothetical protein
MLLYLRQRHLDQGLPAAWVERLTVLGELFGVVEG